MNSYEYGHQPARHGWRRYSWIIALAVGVGLGALLVGLIRGQLWFIGGRGHHADMARRSGQSGQATIRTAPQQDQATAPGTAQQRGSRQADPRRGSAQQPHETDPRGRVDQLAGRDPHRGFFPFAELKLLVALLLIGSGAWLIRGSRRGPGSGGGSGNAARPARPIEPTTAPYDRPETGETRHL